MYTDNTDHVYQFYVTNTCNQGRASFCLGDDREESQNTSVSLRNNLKLLGLYQSLISLGWRMKNQFQPALAFHVDKEWCSYVLFSEGNAV